MKHIKNCEHCNNEFETTYKRVKFCSQKCYHDSRNADVKCNCAYCGTEFIKKKSTIRGNTYCSRDCVAKGTMNIRKNRTLHTDNCVICGAEFSRMLLPGEKGREYCTKKCMRIYRKRLGK